MKIVIGCDHAAFEEKEELKQYLESKGFEIDDVGTHSSERCNYPDYAIALCKKVQSSEIKGILLCGSGIGVSMTANKFSGIRAALCRSRKDAELSREHNDANVLCIGARINTMDQIKEVTDTWLTTDFAGGRHSERVALFSELGEK